MNRHPNLLQRSRSALLIIDVQEKFVPVISEFDRIETNISTLIQGCSLMGVSTFYTEQYPKGLGRTTGALREKLQPAVPFEKLRFSAAGETELLDVLVEHNIKQLILVGIETHVCLLQSALDFLERGYQVYIVADATASRNPNDSTLALQRMREEGITVTSKESVLFELAETSGTDKFRQLSALVK